MSTETETSTTLSRVREAQDALDKARAAMDTVQGGLSAVETVAEKAETARRHPVRTSAIAFLVAIVAAGAFIGIKNVRE